MSSSSSTATRRGSTGIFPTNLTPTLAEGLGLARNSGVLIEDLLPNSPAAQAGLKIGDILTTLNDKPLRDTRQLAVQMFRQRNRRCAPQTVPLAKLLF